MRRIPTIISVTHYAVTSAETFKSHQLYTSNHKYNLFHSTTYRLSISICDWFKHMELYLSELEKKFEF